MKKLSFLTILILFILIFSVNVFANTTNTIKIGIQNDYKNQTTVSVNNDDIDIGFEIANTFTKIVSLNKDTKYIIKPENSFFVKINKAFTSYNDVYNFINSNKSYYPNMIPTVLSENSWCVYLGPYSSLGSINIKNINISGMDYPFSIVQSGSKTINISSSNEILFLNDSLYSTQIKSTYQEPIDLGNKSYRNIIEIVKNTEFLNVINVVDLEEYLYSVVPSEMPSSWPQEALKAQAVASRNYAIRRKNYHSQSGFDLCDLTHCQVYSGYKNEKESTTNAIKDTLGNLIYYNNQLIDAVYSSSNGGTTANAKDVWGTHHDYLVAIKDINEVGGKEWTRSFTFQELTNLAKNIGNVSKIIIERNIESGRVNKITLVGSIGEKVLEKEEIRTFFQNSQGGSLESRNFNTEKSFNLTISQMDSSIQTNLDTIYVQGKSSLSSSNIVGLSVINNKGIKNAISDKNNLSVSSKNGIIGINQNNQIYGPTRITSNNTSTIIITEANMSTVTFYGKGWGHGVGMSQYGAKSLAEKGYNYKQILSYYYTGVTIK